MDTNDILQWLEASVSSEPQAGAIEWSLAHDYQMEVFHEHCAQSLPSQDWNSGSSFTTMTCPLRIMTSGEAEEHDYQVEVYQEYCNESLPGQDWDFGMSCTTETTAAAGAQEDEAAVDQDDSNTMDIYGIFGILEASERMAHASLATDEDLIDLESVDLIDLESVDLIDLESVDLIDLESVDLIDFESVGGTR